MFKYKTCKYDVIIEKVEITKESKVSVWLKRNGHVERKVSNYNIYHDTFADATIWLLNKRISKISSYKNSIKDAQSDIDAINLLDLKDK